MAKPKVIFVVGTRPDAIKSAPVVREFRRYGSQVETRLVSTGQHKEMLTQALNAFGLEADREYAAMQHGQGLSQLSARILNSLDECFAEESPDGVFAQGDTTTTFCASLAAFYRRIPFFHIEAGLRTTTVKDPFPEEFNRRATGLLADLHFAPTTLSRDNLLREGIDPRQIFVTGNSGIDAVKLVATNHHKEWYGNHPGPVIVVTTHRRENWGEPQVQVCRAIREVANQKPEALFVVAMHRNPLVRETLQSHLAGLANVDLIEPPDYADFVKLMERMSFALTDSGGVQEEAPAFGKPVLVLRNTTERPEGVTAGTAKLIGTSYEMVLTETLTLLENQSAYERMAKAVSPYGDGSSAQRIRYATLKWLGIETQKEEMWQ
ncbi:MAG: UDP-N-acetylglucosamine 2-epimerase (non-hydrolyzing) [Fimbriimonadaceae bacterium]|jgi:UDP-N-acetylglucosamine 2-epimerase|nr:UDP-N-acetylglucosamine 2-epimerase (non-hydrolyzing) [Fimbriimonadaceae bacterium]